MVPKKSKPSPAISLVPAIAILALIAVLVGCDSAKQSPDSGEDHAPVGQSDEAHEPLSQVVEFENFNLQVNVARTDFLDGETAERYDIDPAPDHAMLNLVILENHSDGEPKTVSAAVTVQYQTRIGQIETIEMRSVEADGYISYIGTLDASSQRAFNLSIEVQPEGTDEPLHTDFEVELDW